MANSSWAIYLICTCGLTVAQSAISQTTRLSNVAQTAKIENGIPIATIGTEVIEDVSKIIIVAGVTLTAGGPAVTDQGVVVELKYTDILIGTSVIGLPQPLQYLPPVAGNKPASSGDFASDGSTTKIGVTPPTITEPTGYQPATTDPTLPTNTGPITGVGPPSVITVTNSAGSLLTGIPTTVSSVPDLSTTILSNSAWTGNTFTTTSTNDGGPTVLPILLVGGVFIGLFGLVAEIGTDASLFTVYALPGLPDFSLREDGEPELESEEQDQEPSNERSQQKPSQTQPPKTYQPESTASSPVTDDSCTDSTCQFCSTYDYSPDATPDPLNDEDDVAKRALAGRIYVEKRANSNARTTNVVGSKQCAVSKFTNKPDYPGPGSVANNEGAGNPKFNAFYATATYWAVPTNPPNCNNAPGWTFLDTNGIGAYSPPWTLGGNKAKSVNIDHVYEVSLLDEFFAAQIAAGFSCADITTLFDVVDGRTGGTRLNSIFGELPSFTNPDLLGMDSALNRLKGALWNPGLQGAPRPPSNPAAAKNLLADFAVIMSMANDGKIFSLFEATNARIYEAFQGVDNLINTNCGNLKGQNGQPFQPIWADAYSTWMTDKIAGQNQMITSTISALSASIPTMNPQGGKQQPAAVVAQQSSFIASFNAAFQVGGLTFPAPKNWPRNALGIQKRQQACPLTQPLSSFAASQNGRTAIPGIDTTPIVTSTFGMNAALTTPTGPPDGAGQSLASLSSAPDANISATGTLTLVGPTTLCENLSPGGPPECLTISTGCYATSPSAIYNYWPSTTCSTSVQPTLTNAANPTSTLFGLTTFCQGLSPGGGESCLTIQAGCYAISPSYNYVPATTCTDASATTNPQPALTTATPPPVPVLTSSTPPPAPSRLLIIYSDLIALEDGEGTTVKDWYAIDFTITSSPNPGSINACSAEEGQDLPDINNDGYADDLPASWAFASPIATSLSSCTYTVSATRASASATGSLACPGLPSVVGCPPVASATVGSCLGGSTFEIPGLPGIKFGGTVDTPQALAYCEW